MSRQIKNWDFYEKFDDTNSIELNIEKIYLIVHGLYFYIYINKLTNKCQYDIILIFGEMLEKPFIKFIFNS